MCMTTVRFLFEVGRAVFLIGGMAYYAFNNLGAPLPLAVVLGLVFFGMISLIHFLVRRGMRHRP